ncbi:AzlD domain-containing protein [Congregibacter variabilis]|uniref:AzlD domain-containing protein n=1 Tax=Congregibacter variabilis TaxID=3081200 RepID=A0ABZ0I1H3_9GAMM|nr:AzlD domain-containing protein [Congregibacter sp. IMCC43200]
MSQFLAIVLAGIGTYLSRAIFIIALADRQFPPLALRALEYVGPAVMGALIVSMLTTAEGQVLIGLPEVAGLTCAALVAWKTRNHIYTLLTGMAVFWGVAALLV